MTKPSESARAGVRAYLASRQQEDQLKVRQELQDLLPVVAGVRLRTIALYDFAERHRLAEHEPGVVSLMEEEVQTLRALARELEKAVAGLTVAIQAADQLEAVEERLRTALATHDRVRSIGGSGRT